MGYFYILVQPIQTTTRHFAYYKHRQLQTSEPDLQHSIQEVSGNVAETELKEADDKEEALTNVFVIR